MGWLSFWSTKPTDHGEKAEGKPTTRGSEPSQYSDAVLQPTRADGSSQPSSSGPSDWRRFGELSTVVPTIILTTVSIGTYGFYRSYLRRIPAADHISPAFFRRRSIFGKVTSVGDGDNFRIYHTPGGRLAGWGLWRRVPEDKKELQHQTVQASNVHHRLCKCSPAPRYTSGWLGSTRLSSRISVDQHSLSHKRPWIGSPSMCSTDAFERTCTGETNTNESWLQCTPGKGSSDGMWGWKC